MQLPEARLQRTAFLVFAGVIALAFTGLVLRPLLGPVVLGVLTVVVAQPLHRRVERRLGEGTAAAASVSLASLTLLVALPVAGIGRLFAVQLQSVLAEMLGEEQNRSRLVELARQSIEWLSKALRPILGADLDARELAASAVKKVGSGLYEQVPVLLGRLGRLTLGTLLLYLVVFVLLHRGKEILAAVVELSPLEEVHSRRILGRLESTIQGVFLGSLATSLVQGTVGGIGFWLTGFQNQLIWGALIATASFVPFVGTGLVWGPAAVYLAWTGHYGAMAGMLVVGVLVSLVDNLIRPWVIHGQAAVHPLLVFLGLLGGLRSMGPMGLVYGPLVVACFTETVRIYRDEFNPRRPRPAPPPPG
jgi:predicted PurR-regulated permease PerM